jgi:hypothetical protein
MEATCIGRRATRRIGWSSGTQEQTDAREDTRQPRPDGTAASGTATGDGDGCQSEYLEVPTIQPSGLSASSLTD